MTRRVAWRIGLLSWVLAMAGCGQGPNVEYGASRGPSLNGVSAFRALLEQHGHQTRAAVHLGDDVSEWADVIVRFSPQPGAPDREEADWYDFFLMDEPDLKVIYVPRDFEADHEYWTAILDQPDTMGEEQLDDARDNLYRSGGWVARLPEKAEKPAAADEWFTAGPIAGTPDVVKGLSGPWSAGVDAAAARLPVHESLKAEGAKVLLSGDSMPLVIARGRPEGGGLLVVASGGFLLNAALANPARRPLAERVAEWIGPEPRRVAFVEGGSPLAEFSEGPTLWGLLARLDGLRMVAIHLAVAGLAAALYRAPRLGRPREPELSWGGRPVAHAEALGALLARAADRDVAQKILVDYDRWRHEGNPNRAPRHEPSSPNRDP